MKLYKFTCGADEKIGVFADEKEANSRRAEVDPTFQYVNTTIEEVRIPGYNITITPTGKVAAPSLEASGPDQFDEMDRDALKEWLKSTNVEHMANWGEQRLRETARAAYAAMPRVTIDSVTLESEPRTDAEWIARQCHEVNRAYCLSLGDTSQPAWEDAPQWQRDSAINGVKFHLENETTPAQSHENWMREKVADGWVYGPVKDPEKKEHPCMVPYEELPVEQRTKDYLFKSVVDTYKSAQQMKTEDGQ